MARVQTSDLAGFEEGKHLARIRGLLTNTRSVLEAIGAMITRQSGDAFRKQRMGREHWAPRMTPNVPGIIHDFTLGRSAPPERRFVDRPVLHDTGALAKSVTWRVVGTSIVEVGSNLPYANVLHAGGTSHSDIITREVQGRLYKWMKRQKNAARRASVAPQNRLKRERNAAVRNDPQINAWKDQVASINRQLKMHREAKKRMGKQNASALQKSVIRPLMARKKNLNGRIKKRRERIQKSITTQASAEKKRA